MACVCGHEKDDHASGGARECLARELVHGGWVEWCRCKGFEALGEFRAAERLQEHHDEARRDRIAEEDALAERE